MTPLGESTRDRVMREMRLKESAFEEGLRQGRMEATAQFEKRLAVLERQVRAMWDAFCRDETRVIERGEEHG